MVVPPPTFNTTDLLLLPCDTVRMCWPGVVGVQSIEACPGGIGTLPIEVRLVPLSLQYTSRPTEAPLRSAVAV